MMLLGKTDIPGSVLMMTGNEWHVPVSMVPWPFLIITPKGRILAANAAAAELLCRAEDSLIGSTAISFLEDGNENFPWDRYRELIRGGRDQISFRANIFRGGRLIGAEITLARYSPRHGRTSREIYATLEARPLGGDQGLEARNEALARSNKELEEFAFIASHDLNEPLNKIAMFGQLLQDATGEKLNEECSEYLSYMRNAATRLQDLIESLLDLSRVTSKGKPFQPVQLQGVLDEVLSDFKFNIEESGAIIKTTPLPAVSADPVQMRQLLQNLVGNALKFTHPGQPPSIEIKTSKLIPSEPFPGMVPQATYVRLMVRDEGIGFEQRHAGRIFRPLQRLNPRSAYTGTGIGLAICRKIVHRHHGWIAARSKPGEGATFAVLLPLMSGT